MAQPAPLFTSILRQLPRSVWEYAVFYFALAYFGVAGIVFTLVSAMLNPLLPQALGKQLGRTTSGFLFRSYLGMLEATRLLHLDLGALDKLRHEGGMVIAPNHPCLLDAVFVISRVPQTVCIMKAAIWDNPVLGGGARLSGYIRNDSPRSMIRSAASEARAGVPVLVFPEGTRTRGTGVSGFRGGFALIARRARVPVQTVFIETNSPFLGKGWPLWKKPRLPLHYRVRLGRQFNVGNDIHAFVAELRDYYNQELTGPPAAGAAQSAEPGMHEEAHESTHA